MKNEALFRDMPVWNAYSLFISAGTFYGLYFMGIVVEHTAADLITAAITITWLLRIDFYKRS